MMQWVRAAFSGFLVMVVAVACNPVRLPDIELNRVEPDFAFTGENTTVTLHGSLFFPRLEIKSQSGQSEFDDDFQAWLVGPDGNELSRPFAAVQFENFDRLRGTIPAGYPPGVYNVRLEGPGGAIARLPSAFTVTAAKPNRLDVELQSPAGVYPVGQRVFLDLTLLDLAEKPFGQSIEIAITALRGEQADVSLITDYAGLQNTRLAPDGDSIVGLMPDGRVTIGITGTETGTIDVEVAPWDRSLGIGRDDLEVRFGSSQDYTINFEPLPDPVNGDAYVAGETVRAFARAVDLAGNPIDDAVTVTLVAKCGGWVDLVVLDGPEPSPFEFVPVEICEKGTIVALDVGSAPPLGESASFEVVAGEVSGFDMRTLLPSVVAGDLVDVLLHPVDEFGNETGYLGPLTVTSPNGGLIESTCDHPVGAGTTRFCHVRPSLAGTISLVASGDGTLFGSVAGLIVLPRSEPVDANLVVPSSTVAGLPFDVEIQPFDTFGNVIDASAYGLTDLGLDDSLNELECALQPPVGTRMLWTCRLYTSRENAQVQASFTVTGITVDSRPFEVLPGPIGSLGVEVADEVTAGDSVPIQVIAQDDFGNDTAPNPAIHVVLSDTTGTFSAPSATLANQSRTVVVGTFELAGPTELRATVQGSSLEGVSSPITVRPGAAASWKVQSEGWVWADTPSVLEVQAIDAYGNPTPLDAQVDVSSDRGSLPTERFPVQAGQASLPIRFVSGVGLETVTVTDDLGRFGQARLPVVEPCVDGPVPSLEFATEPDGRACLDPVTELGAVAVNGVGSIEGASPIETYAFAVDGTRQLLQDLSQATVTLPGVGRYDVAMLVSDTRGCGAIEHATAWVGPDDGTPVGPIPITTTESHILETDMVEVRLQRVMDCRGQPAAFAEVGVRSSVGALAPVASTGTGLHVSLDGQGDAVLQVVTTGNLSEGTATVHAYVPSGAAEGALFVPVQGDSVPPILIAQTPTGTIETAQTGGIQFVVSEPLLPSSVLPSSFHVQGPFGDVPVLGLLLDEQDRRIQLDLGVTLDTGEYDVVVSDSVLDVAGNPLSGDYTGQASLYDGAFGFVTYTQANVSCGTDLSRFRPDGDPGTGVEA
ncbi:MAG: Ig-like domain-containing protein, partial [Myxococcota bacterium]